MMPMTPLAYEITLFTPPTFFDTAANHWRHYVTHTPDATSSLRRQLRHVVAFQPQY
jgi:hypothetical protein